MIPHCLGSRFADGGTVVGLTYWTPHYLPKTNFCFWYSFYIRGWVNPRSSLLSSLDSYCKDSPEDWARNASDKKKWLLGWSKDCKLFLGLRPVVSNHKIAAVGFMNKVQLSLSESTIDNSLMMFESKDTRNFDVRKPDRNIKIVILLITAWPVNWLSTTDLC
jgi:hypothetical protein